LKENRIKLRTKIIGIVIMLVGLLGIIDTFIALKNHWGYNFGTFFPAAVGAFMIIIGFIEGIMGSYRLGAWYRNSKRVILTLLFILFISFLFIEGVIIYNGLNKDKVKTDYLIVLGAGLRGETPSLALMNRMKSALVYANKYPDVLLVLSGGQGIEETISEGEAMKRYFIANGIEEDRLILEDKAKNTYENFKNSYELLNNLGVKMPVKIMIETNNFHMFRSKFLAKRVGFIAYGEPSAIPYYLIPNLYIREYFAVIKSFLLDR